MALMYIPGRGFTYLIEFGERGHERYLPEVQAIDHYEIPDSDGYDGKAYVQIAMRPNLGEPTLHASVDGLAYRARRMLFLWSAWLLGAGNPSWVMEVYSLQNVICWFVLAAILQRWFPPDNWENVLRWGFVLFSFGLVFSARSALLDGPSLLLIAVAMVLIESRRPWLATAVLGVSGLGKETNVLAGLALQTPRGFSVRGYLAFACRVGLVVLPLLLWVGCITLWIGNGKDPGARNFALPFHGFLSKLKLDVSELGHERYHFTSVAKFDFLVLLGLASQFLFFVLRPDRGSPWWRLGIGYGILMVFLGSGVWEGYPTAASRVLLPMALAFNVLVPRGRGWLMVLLAGNLGVISTFDLFRLPPRASMSVSGPAYLRHNMTSGKDVSVAFTSANWRGAERSTFDYWRWSQGNCEIEVFNPQPFPIRAEIHMVLRTLVVHKITILFGDAPIWSGDLQRSKGQKVSLNDLVVKPGKNVFVFRTQGPLGFNAQQQPIDFGVWNAVLVLDGKL
jgi:hypothetical protein